jgi:sugar phosphate isomerase/epimerase
MRDILLDLFVDVDLPITDTIITYDFQTKYANYYAFTKDYIMTRLKEFVLLWKQIEKNKNKLVVSNLCWNDDNALHILSRYGILNLELAITKHIKWSDNLSKIKDIYKDFNIYSLQALFYGLNYNVFTDNDAFKGHFKRVINIAIELGVKRLVFGSPINKYKPDDLNIQDADNIFINTFKELAVFLPSDMMICIEHNAIEYKCNYLTTIQSVINIIEKINNSKIKLNLDTGNALMMHDAYNFIDIKNYTGHIQISAPFLKDIIGQIYDFKDYNFKISLEACNLIDFEKNLIYFILQS